MHLKLKIILKKSDDNETCQIKNALAFFIWHHNETIFVISHVGCIN